MARLWDDCRLSSVRPSFVCHGCIVSKR